MKDAFSLTLFLKLHRLSDDLREKRTLLRDLFEWRRAVATVTAPPSTVRVLPS